MYEETTLQLINNWFMWSKYYVENKCLWYPFVFMSDWYEMYDEKFGLCDWTFWETKVNEMWNYIMCLWLDVWGISYICSIFD